MNELMFSKRCFDAARHTATGDAVFARRVSGRKRRRYGGKAWTGSGLAKAQRAGVGKVIGSRRFEEDARWSFAK